jgi:hypothetical protein
MPVISGQTTVAAPGSAVPLGTDAVNGPLLVKALDSNSGIVAVGNNGLNDVSLSSGLRLAAGEVLVFDFAGSLASLWLDAAAAGDGVSWILLSV